MSSTFAGPGDRGGSVERSAGPATLCLHAGTRVDAETGGVCTPVFPSTAHLFPNPENENRYPRYFNTPNPQVVARKVAALEGAVSGLVLGSGMAAISSCLFAHLGPGDHAVFQADLYGGTRMLVEELRQRGTAITFARDAAEFAAGLRPQTRVLYVESPSNPLLRVVDLEAVGRLGREHGILTVADNTFATPINQNPLQLGVDVVIHSATKYLNGHSDVTAGGVVGSAAAVDRTRHCAIRHGGAPDAHACYLLERGMKTLALRMARHNATAGHLAEYLRGHGAVAAVHYPGLPSHPDHVVAAKQMRGFGGMLSFELRAPERAEAVLAAFRVVSPALSLGGVESLACIPSRTSHKDVSAEERRRAGIGDGLIRLSVGLEDREDLVGDLESALAAAGG